MKRLYFSLGATVVALALLTGCGGSVIAEPTLSPLPSPSASPVETPSASPTSEAPNPQFASLTLFGDHTVAADTVGNEMARIDYFDDAAVTVATLTDLFEFQPVIDVIDPGPSDVFAGTRYDWEGFKVFWEVNSSQAEPGVGERPYFPTVFVASTVTNVRGVTIEGFDGVLVGDSMAEIMERHPDHIRRLQLSDGESASVQLGVVPLPPLESEPELEVGFAVAALGRTDGNIDMIGAPSQVNFGL